MNLHPYNFEVLSRQREQELRTRASNEWKWLTGEKKQTLKARLLSRVSLFKNSHQKQGTPACCC